MFTNASHINQRHTIVSFSRHNTPLDRGLTQGVIVVYEKGLVAESQNIHDWVSCGGPTFSETSLLRDTAEGDQAKKNSCGSMTNGCLESESKRHANY